ncbi:MAG: ECF-type sigma factor [Gemmatimonadota bacterium]
MEDLGTSQPPNRHDITDLLRAHRAGDESAVHELVPLVYAELHQIAHRQLGGERPGHTLQTTGLVHEAFAKFVGLERIQFSDRAHFFALSARLMRQVLTDYAKRRQAIKRRGVHVPVSPEDEAVRARGEVAIEALIDLDRALEELAEISERQTRVIECRFFGGLTVEETADALEISPATVKRDWQLARAWLNRELA